MLTGHLYNFTEEKSIQIPCPLFIFLLFNYKILVGGFGGGGEVETASHYVDQLTSNS
jgi:hypothetical protein